MSRLTTATLLLQLKRAETALAFTGIVKHYCSRAIQSETLCFHCQLNAFEVTYPFTKLESSIRITDIIYEYKQHDGRLYDLFNINKP